MAAESEEQRKGHEGQVGDDVALEDTAGDGHD